MSATVVVPAACIALYGIIRLAIQHATQGQSKQDETGD